MISDKTPAVDMLAGPIGITPSSETDPVAEDPSVAEEVSAFHGRTMVMTWVMREKGERLGLARSTITLTSCLFPHLYPLLCPKEAFTSSLFTSVSFVFSMF